MFDLFLEHILYVIKVITDLQKVNYVILYCGFLINKTGRHDSKTICIFLIWF